MTEHDVERMLESTDLSNRSKIRTSLRRDLLDRNPRQMPRSAWAFNAMALGVIVVGAFAILALVMGGGGGGITPAAQPTPEGWSHEVKDGETLQCIVEQFGYTDVYAIDQTIALNGLQSADDIQVGQVLAIPTPGPANSNAYTFDEATQLAGFTVLSPAYLPANVTLKSFTIERTGDAFSHVLTVYYHIGSSFADSTYLIIDQAYPADPTTTLVPPGVDGGTAQDVTVRGQQGKYYVMIQPSAQGCAPEREHQVLAWIEEGMVFRIMGNKLNADELTQVAESLGIHADAPRITPANVAELPTATPANPSVMELQPTIVPFHHTVQAGETLLAIVQQYGWENGDIIPTVLQMNGLTSEDQITVGQTLMIPPRIETAPFEPCPAGYNPGVPPTMVPGQEVPSSETATPFPTIVPCALPTSAPIAGGDFGPNSAMTATPLPFDPAAPTVPPSGFMLPTPTPAAPSIQSIEELSALVGFDVVDFASVPAGYELQARGAQMFTPEIKGVTTTYIRRASAKTSYIELKQIDPSMSLEETAARRNIQVANAEETEVGDQDALWLEGYNVGLSTSSASYVANVLIWNTGEFSYVLVADDLTQEQMIDLAEGLQ